MILSMNEKLDRSMAAVLVLLCRGQKVRSQVLVNPNPVYGSQSLVQKKRQVTVKFKAKICRNSQDSNFF